MEVRVLGPLTVRCDGADVALPKGYARVVLATLALHHGGVVSRDRLIASIWGPDAPATAATQLHRLVSVLRHGLPAGTIETIGTGYRLPATAVTVDLREFREALDLARALARDGDLTGAAAAYQRALGAWTGAGALEGIDSAYLAPAAAQLDELRLVAVEEWADAALASGEHAAVPGVLTWFVGREPLRESMCAKLMLALYRSGRQADALEAYRLTRQALVDGLGVEPGPELRDLHHRILTADPRLTGDRPVPPATGQPDPAAPEDGGTQPPAVADPRPATRPAQLPRDVSDFTGRRKLVAELYDLLSGHDETCPSVAAVVGPGGAGKTTLALHVAHRLARHLPGGSLYVDLRGSRPDPLAPAAVLRRLLRDLGVPQAAVPREEEERGALLRSVLSGREIVIVLDDARDAVQVRPLLPGGTGCPVLVTSRRRLAALAGVTRVELGRFDEDEAGALFDRVVGADRTMAEPEARRRVLAACAGLPLAVRIAAARLASRPGWTLADLAEQLCHARRPLDALCVEDMAVRASISLSYAHLPPPARRVLRMVGRLGLGAGGCFGVLSTAALTGYPAAQTERALEELVDVHLLESYAPGRYGFHELVHAFAAEQTEATGNTEPAGQGAGAEQAEGPAHRRMLEWFLHAATAAAQLVPPLRPVPDLPPPDGLELPPLPDAGAALRWYRCERESLRTALRLAGTLNLHRYRLELPLLLAGLFERAGHFDDWVGTHEIALAAAAAISDRAGAAWALLGIGAAHSRLGRPADGTSYLWRARDLGRSAGVQDVVAAALAMLHETPAS